jgi:catechol 2,3-dioxygenase-like lactoylglutathione lyase family enzyme
VIVEDLARRFLHVNLNCASLAETERFYADSLGMRTVMRTDPDTPVDGSFLGLGGDIRCETAFMYDARGGREGCALEAIEFADPPMTFDHADPLRPGIRAALFTVADLDAVGERLREAGVTVSAVVAGLCSGARAMLVAGPDGIVVEIAERTQALSAGGLFSGVRIATADSRAAGEFLRAIGFRELAAPASTSVAGDRLSPNGSTAAADCLVSRYGLAEDADRFTVTVVEHPVTAPSPVPWGGNRQGLYRCALRVEDLDRALAGIADTVEVVGDRVWCPLPGTKIDGLHIAFLRSPDGVVFEFVERPLRHFGA